jgi:hypothetical protein
MELGTYKMIGGLTALLFFMYSVTVFLDSSVISSSGKDDSKSKNMNYVIGILYLMLAVMLAYVSFV